MIKGAQDLWFLKCPIAHRGLHSNIEAPENSIEAFRRAMENGYPIELDLQLSRDDRIVVFHDDDLSAMAGIAGAISDHNYSTIKSASLLRTRFQIPSLEEVLNFVNGRVALLIEIKNQENGSRINRVAWNLLARYTGQFAIQSFNPFTIAWFKNHAPGVPRGLLAGDFKSAKLNFFIKIAMRDLLFTGFCRPTFIAYDTRCLPHWAPAFARTFGIPIIAWTVREKAEWERVVKYADNYIFEGFNP